MKLGPGKGTLGGTSSFSVNSQYFNGITKICYKKCFIMIIIAIPCWYWAKHIWR